MKNDRKTYRIRVWGGMGDALMLTPTIKALKLREPGCRVIIYSHSKLYDELLLHNPNIDMRISIASYLNVFNQLRYLFFRKSIHYLTYGWVQPSLFYRNLHAVEVTGKMMDVDVIDKQVQVCITKEEDNKAVSFLKQYKNPILIQITSSCAKTQNWPVKKWEELITRMPEYTFLQIGAKNEAKVKGAVNLLGKTTIRESLALLKNARSFAAVVSFLNHASNAFLTKGVVLFGPSTPKTWGYPHNINIYKNLVCAPCIDLICGEPCPYNAECIQDISVEEVQDALEIQLGIKKEVLS